MHPSVKCTVCHFICTPQLDFNATAQEEMRARITEMLTVLYTGCNNLILLAV